MSRRRWTCRNSACTERGGATLGRLTSDGGLALDPAVVAFRVFLDTRRAVVVCPVCRTEREFRGRAILSSAPT